MGRPRQKTRTSLLQVWLMWLSKNKKRNPPKNPSANLALVTFVLCRGAALFADELLKQEQARLNEARKISVVNVNPTNIRPHSDTPEIRKYKKRFNSEILCAALWGENDGCFENSVASLWLTHDGKRHWLANC